MKRLYTFLAIFFISNIILSSQPDRWQQKVNYKMDIDFDVNTHRYAGRQKLVYSNNSPDVLSKVYYHLYLNTFQPNSIMDIRSRNLPDPDGRVRDRISKLKDDEIGYHKIHSLTQDGKPVQYTVEGTILEVTLDHPIQSKSKSTFEMEWDSQVPIQIRRTGRNNREGVDYSMSQWYPKLCEYDYQGWHANPYVAREFYGVWGDFEVNIKIDKKYLVAAGGYIQNAKEVGYGYEAPGEKVKPTNRDKLLWRWKAEHVHDFMWAADRDYKHTKLMNDDGIEMNFFYIENDKTRDTWAQLPIFMNNVFKYADRHFGLYPYKYFAYIQGGDGGMEYPMSTLILGEGKLEGLVGLATHEMMHSWYQGVLGTNESLYPWMDEGFTSYAEDVITSYYNKTASIEEIKDALRRNPNNRTLQELLPALPDNHSNAYAGYFGLVKSGYEEPLTTHADHFNTNYAYSVAAYSKGEVFMEQLGYIVGAAVRDKILLEYYNQWHFKHPNSNDFIVVAEKVSGIKLDWYKEYWCNTTKTINYAIDSLWEDAGVTKVRIKRIGQMPMPVDLQVTFKDGSTEMHYVPLNLMFGEKPAENPGQKRVVHDEWRWTHPTYVVEIKHRLTDFTAVEIDPSKRMADTERKNNLLELKW